MILLHPKIFATLVAATVGFPSSVLASVPADMSNPDIPWKILNIGSWVTECCGLRGHDLVGQVALLMLGLGAWVTQQLFLVLGWAHRLTPSLCIL